MSAVGGSGLWTVNQEETGTGDGAICATAQDAVSKAHTAKIARLGDICHTQ